ncbi:PRC-barrel domain-containing protein [Alkalilacustris brevis]|uniref:PRC-barrel domain-containing protein n=1 Tax=Alkalilacustris brevis TaxID=2026338 RepID=UPI000E0DFBD5|nr:PRC-barrel domain-containing protein [Alkalilacustris brevis]
MKKLLSTTALVVALGFPAVTLAQTAPPANPATQQHNAAMGSFLAERSSSDLFASDLLGHDVYARRVQGDTTASGDRASVNADGTHDLAMMNRAELENMENIGQINEVVLSNDGQVRAIVIGAGGFLGMGEHEVAVTMDQVTFASDSDDRSQMYIVVNTGADMLLDAPAYDRTAARADRAERTDDTRNDQAARTGAAEVRDETRTERTAFAAPEVQRDGYNRVEVTDVSTEMLMGENVYDINDNDVGSVTDMILDGDGAITNVIIDFGGFLGIGTSQASLRFDELTILSTEGYDSVRLYVDASKEQIQELPQYSAAN